jgi:hypothetical protein
MKYYVRKRSEQSLPKMIALMKESRVDFETKGMNLKLQRRFWRTMSAYADGKGYKEVLCLYFGSRCEDAVAHHRQITNTNINK